MTSVAYFCIILHIFFRDLKGIAWTKNSVYYGSVNRLKRIEEDGYTERIKRTDIMERIEEDGYIWKGLKRTFRLKGLKRTDIWKGLKRTDVWKGLKGRIYGKD